jgi:restriction endonuclease S subunit
MREGWKEISLEDLENNRVIKLGRGDVISKKDIGADPGPNPVYSSAENKNGMIGKYAKFMFDEELITWSVDGGGHIFYRPKHKFSVTNIGGWLRILDQNVFSYQFLAYALQILHKQHSFDWQYKAHPSVIRKLYTRIPLPPLVEQKRIVDLISSVDSYIEALQQQVDKARKSRNAVLHELLTKGGDGWVETTLGEVAQFFNGKAYSKEELLSQGKYRVLRVGNFFSNNSWYWSDLELESEKYCEAGDLLYAWSASFGPRIWKEEKVIYHYHIWKIMENPNLILKTWLFYWLDNDVEEMKSAAGTGSIMMHITKGEIEKRKIMLPSIEIQQVQIGVLQSFDATIQAQEATLKNTLNLRSALLSDLLSGNHEIPTTYDKLIGAA